MSEDKDDGAVKRLVVNEVLKAAADSPEMRRAGRSIGSAVAIIAETVNHALLPLAAVNFGIAKAKTYFASTFSQEFQEKTKSIPAEHLIEPKPSVAGPALQGLSFSLDEPDLKEMYLNLLRTSVDSRLAHLAHPAFVEIIKQLNATEAVLITEIMGLKDWVPIARGRIKIEGGFRGPDPLIVDSSNKLSNDQEEIPRVDTMFENWVRLGLISIDFSQWMIEDSAYDWVQTHPTFLSLRAFADGGEPDFVKGIFRPTAMGKNFGIAVGAVV